MSWEHWETGMLTILAPAAAYAGAVFALGFVLGTIRVLFAAPALGEQWAAAIEVPLMLWVSWGVCRRAMHCFSVPPTLRVRTALGLIAFALLQAAELALGIGLLAQSLRTVAAELLTFPKAIGLAAQVVFAAFPALQIWRAHS